MKVYIITGAPFPVGMAASNRIVCLAKAFISAKEDCKVIIYKRNYLNETIPGNGVYEGVPYEYLGGSPKRARGIFIAKIQSFLLRFHLIYFLLNRIQSGDIIYDYIGYSNFLKWLTIHIVHKKGGFCVRELCEYPFGTGVENKRSIKQRKYALNHLFPQYDGVVAISDALVDLAKQYCSPKCVIQKIPILVDFDKYNMPDESSLASVPYIFHSGTLYEQKDGILGMIEAFGIATKNIDIPIKFISTGNKEKSPHYHEIDNLIKKYDLEDKVIFTGYISDEELKTYLRRASVCIINKYPNQQNRYCFSTKLGEYMAAGKGIIITRVGEAMNWLEGDKDAIIVEPNDTQALSNAIVNLFRDKELCNALGNQARNKCRQVFDFHCYNKVLTDFIINIKNQDNI